MFLGKRRRGFKSTAYNYTSSIVFSIVKHVFSDGTINFDVVSGKEDGTRSIIFPTVKHVFSDGTVNFEVVSWDGTARKIFRTVKYVFSDESVNFDVVTGEEGRDKCLKENSIQKVPLQFRGVCSNEIEVVSINSKIQTSEFCENCIDQLGADRIAELEANRKNIHITKYVFSDGRFTIHILIEKEYVPVSRAKFFGNLF